MFEFAVVLVRGVEQHRLGVEAEHLARRGVHAALVVHPCGEQVGLIQAVVHGDVGKLYIAVVEVQLGENGPVCAGGVDGIDDIFHDVVILS